MGLGELTSLITLCELGDVGRARVGKLNRQGSPNLRWALYEAALSASRPSSPDHADDLALKARGLSHTRASLTIARKLARRSFHVLRELDPDALDPLPMTPPKSSLRHRPRSDMADTLPASRRSYRGSHPDQAAAHQRPSGRSHSTRTDRSTITSATPTRSRTQISPGIHGDQHPDHHNHSPPTLTQAPVQISDSQSLRGLRSSGRARSQA
jgi:hypothetical protein